MTSNFLYQGIILAALILTALTLATTSGCRQASVSAYELSDTVQTLGSEAETDEERAMWADLRAQIAQALIQYTGTPRHPKRLDTPDADPDRLAAGAAVYRHRCQSCHGADGGGNGEVAEYLNPRPRNYQKGVFKFTSTPYGSKPRLADLIRTIRRGVTGTSMPSFDMLEPGEIEAVAEYVMVLAQRGQLETELATIAVDEEFLDEEYIAEIANEIAASWLDAKDATVLPLTPMPPMTAESIAAGHKLFLKQACNKCHGKDGRGGSQGSVDVGLDVWGNKAAAADLTSGMFRGGGRPLDVYRRIHAGINGTPMPAFSGIFAEDQAAAWSLVHFILDTGERRRRNELPLDNAKIAALESELGISSAPSADSTATAEPATESDASGAPSEATTP